MVIGFIGLLINIPINYIFIYGRFGMPQLGGGWLRRGHWQRLLAHVPYDTLVRQTSTLAARHIKPLINEHPKAGLGSIETPDPHWHTVL